MSKVNHLSHLTYLSYRHDPYLPHPRVRYWGVRRCCAQLLLHPCQSRQKYPAAMSSIHFRQVRGFKTISADLVRLLHSCFLLGHTHLPPHPLQKILIFRQLLYCTASPHSCLCPSGGVGGRITQLWREKSPT